MSQSNPFESPQSAPETAAEAEYMAVARRPATPLVIGIISLVFAAFGLLGLIATLFTLLAANDMAQQQTAVMQAMGYHPAYYWASQIVGALLTVWLLIVGIGLLRYRNRARLGFNGYALLIIAWQVVNTIYLVIRMIGSDFDGMAVAMVVGGIAGGLFSLLFPVLGMVFLNRPHVVASLK